MLLYKAWYESRSRFFYTLAGLTLMCTLLVVSYPSWGLDPARVNFRGFVWNALYYRFFHAAWVFSTLFLSLGGLLAERREGTALFTLSLPASRRRMLLARAGVCFGEAVVAALLPAISISAFSPVVGETYPVGQSLEFAFLLTVCGVAFFGFGILLSSIMGGGWAPLAVGVPVIAGIYTTTKSITSLRAFNPQDLFSTARSVQPPSWSPGPLPWAAIVVVTVIAVAFLLLSILVTEKLEF